jgi:hypothetical protein
MYVIKNMRPVATILEMGEGVKGKDAGGYSNMTYLIYCKDFCKCHKVSPASTTIKISHFS